MSSKKWIKLISIIGLVTILVGAVFFSVSNLKEKTENNLATATISQNAQNENTEKIAEPTPEFTDDNTGETVIIKSDQENYTGDKEIESYFSVQNTGKNFEQILWRV